MSDDLLRLLRATYGGQAFPATAPFVEHFRRTGGDALLAVVLYGSRIDPSLCTETSFFDFYLICRDYASFFARRRDRWLARMLPPNIYYLELPNAAGTKQVCKYCVISLADLQDAVGARAKDLYHLGRFSKRLALLWRRDEAAGDAVLGACRQAMLTLLPHALGKMNDAFTLPDLVRQALALSYEGEVRLEKTGEKVDALFHCAEDFYLEVWDRLLADYRAAHVDLFAPDDPPGVIHLRARPTPPGLATPRLLARSRRRAKARWPKNILLVDNWVDILLDKVERTYGVKLNLTPRERRWALILGWKHFFRLRREGKIR